MITKKIRGVCEDHGVSKHSYKMYIIKMQNILCNAGCSFSFLNLRFGLSFKIPALILHNKFMV